MRRRNAPRHFAWPTLAALTLAGCVSDPTGGRVLIEISIVPVSGNQQVVPSGGLEAEPLVVRLVDQNQSPRSGFTIEWKISRGAGTLSATSSTSDANGYAQVTYRSGTEAGEVEVTANLSFGAGGATAGRPAVPAVFQLTVGGAASSLRPYDR